MIAGRRLRDEQDPDRCRCTWADVDGRPDCVDDDCCCPHHTEGEVGGGG